MYEVIIAFVLHLLEEAVDLVFKAVSDATAQVPSLFGLSDGDGITFGSAEEAETACESIKGFAFDQTIEIGGTTVTNPGYVFFMTNPLAGFAMYLFCLSMQRAMYMVYVIGDLLVYAIEQLAGVLPKLPDVSGSQTYSIFGANGFTVHTKADAIAACSEFVAMVSLVPGPWAISASAACYTGYRLAPAQKALWDGLFEYVNYWLTQASADDFGLQFTSTADAESSCAYTQAAPWSYLGTYITYVFLYVPCTINTRWQDIIVWAFEHLWGYLATATEYEVTELSTVEDMCEPFRSFGLLPFLGCVQGARASEFLVYKATDLALWALDQLSDLINGEGYLYDVMTSVMAWIGGMLDSMGELFTFFLPVYNNDDEDSSSLFERSSDDFGGHSLLEVTKRQFLGQKQNEKAAARVKDNAMTFPDLGSSGDGGIGDLLADWVAFIKPMLIGIAEIGFKAYKVKQEALELFMPAPTDMQVSTPLMLKTRRWRREQKQSC